MPEDHLKTKLFPPPPRPNQVMREPLLEKFAQARQRGMTCTLVSAPAGFGKTTIVADCIRASGQPLAWLALDEGDNDLLHFWRYVDEALSTLDHRIGEGLRLTLYTNQTPSIQQIITGLVNDVTSLDKELTLVLDDYHFIELPAIHDSLNFLLDHLPARMCLVIITRADPPLNLARRRGRGQLLEIRAADLRFTHEETAAFLNQTMKLGLDDPDIASLGQRTEGWIAGLQMAALSLQSEIDRHRFVAAFSGDDRHIADYLVEEVLQRQLIEVQHFLLQTSILDGLNASLCDAVTGRQDSRIMLNTLERANLFILPLDSRREWFRYHHLFAELLRQRLRETYNAKMLANLHRTAASWYESQGDIAAAVRHLRTTSDDRSVMHILERSVGKFFSGGELPQLFELACLLPIEVRKESPFLCASVVWAGMAGNRYIEILPWLESLEAYFDFQAEELFNNPALETARRAALLEFMILQLQAPSIPFPGDKRAPPCYTRATQRPAAWTNLPAQYRHQLETCDCLQSWSVR